MKSESWPLCYRRLDHKEPRLEPNWVMTARWPEGLEFERDSIAVWDFEVAALRRRLNVIWMRSVQVANKASGVRGGPHGNHACHLLHTPLLSSWQHPSVVVWRYGCSHDWLGCTLVLKSLVAKPALFVEHRHIFRANSFIPVLWSSSHINTPAKMCRKFIALLFLEA